MNPIRAEIFAGGVLLIAVAMAGWLIYNAYDLGREHGCTEEMELRERYS